MSNARTEYETNLQLAQLTLRLIKRSVISLNDLIPTSDLPLSTKDAEAKEVELKYGTTQAEAFKIHDNKTVAIREKVVLACRSLQSIDFPISSTNLAITVFGVGECSETTNLAMVKLCQLDCKTTINIIGLQGYRSKFSNLRFRHGFIILGDCDQLTNNLASLDTLPKSCVYLDPSLGLIGRAKDIRKLLAKDIAKYGYDQIAEQQVIPPGDTGYKITVKNALLIAKAALPLLGEYAHLYSPSVLETTYLGRVTHYRSYAVF